MNIKQRVRNRFYLIILRLGVVFSMLCSLLAVLTYYIMTKNADLGYISALRDLAESITVMALLYVIIGFAVYKNDSAEQK